MHINRQPEILHSEQVNLMIEKILTEIVANCCAMDRQAVAVYRSLAEYTDDPELQRFWQQMMSEEETHVTYWENLLDLATKGALPQIFQHPDQVNEELRAQREKIKKIAAKSEHPLNRKEQFFMAFRLEFYMLHPNLEKLWKFYDIIHPDSHDPGKEYKAHIRNLAHAGRKFGDGSIELEVLSETLEKMWEQIQNSGREAYFDPLTGILNRRGMLDAMKTMGFLAKRNQFGSGVLMIDIDNFKRINDTLGHEAGDQVIRRVAERIKANVRSSDLVGRFGGEEFLVFLPQVDQDGISALAEKIRHSVANDTQKETAVTISIGAAGAVIKRSVEEALHQLILDADTMLFAAKKQGRNRVAITAAQVG